MTDGRASSSQNSQFSQEINSSISQWQLPPALPVQMSDFPVFSPTARCLTHEASLTWWSQLPRRVRLCQRALWSPWIAKRLPTRPSLSKSGCQGQFWANKEASGFSIFDFPATLPWEICRWQNPGRSFLFRCTPSRSKANEAKQLPIHLTVNLGGSSENNLDCCDIDSLIPVLHKLSLSSIIEQRFPTILKRQRTAKRHFRICLFRPN